VDGAKSNDILQTGTASEGDQHCIWFACWGVTSYWSWTEWYPNPPHDTANITQGFAKTISEPMPIAKGVAFFSGDTIRALLAKMR
jgi:hypothetical protein